MNDILDFFQAHPFILGLGIGLLVAIFSWAKGMLRAISLRREIKQLKDSMYTKMQVETKGQMALGEEVEQLRKENGNLRVTVKSLQQKPGRAEIRQFYIYERAIRSLLRKSPGFGPAWEQVLKEAEEDFSRTETGLGAFIRRVFSPPITQQEPGKGLVENSSKQSDADS